MEKSLDPKPVTGSLVLPWLSGAAVAKNYGLATGHYPVLDGEATVEPFENGRGFSLLVLRR